MSKRVSVKPRKRPQQSRSRATVDALLEATAYILEREGFEGASTNRIAARAGVNIGSLYQYFPNKESLVAGLIEREATRYVESIRRAFESAERLPLRRAFPQLARAHIAFYAARARLMRTLHQQVPRVQRLDYVRQVQDVLGTMLTEHLRRLDEPYRVDDLGAAASAVVKIVDALTLAALFDSADSFDAERLVDRLADIVTRYLLP